jgi:hypothetical protein
VHSNGQHFSLVSSLEPFYLQACSQFLEAEIGHVVVLHNEVLPSHVVIAAISTNSSTLCKYISWVDGKP